jgi:hypothetical protein
MRISPKVSAVLIAGFLASVILPNVGLVTPEMLHSLGPWGPFWYGVAVTGISALAGYWKRDPLRDAGKAAQAPGTGRHVAAPELTP